MFYVCMARCRFHNNLKYCDYQSHAAANLLTSINWKLLVLELLLRVHHHYYCHYAKQIIIIMQQKNN